MKRCILSEMFRYAVSLKWCSVGTQEAPLEAGWTHGFMHFMLNCHSAMTMLQHRPWSLWTVQRFPRCSADDIPTMASSHSFWADRVEPGVVLCCCGPSILRFDYLSDFRCPPAHHCGTELLLAFSWAICQLEQILSFDCDLSWQQGLFVHKPVRFFCLFVPIFCSWHRSD